MSALSFFSKQKEEVSILIDIGNGSITGALVLFKQNNIPHFLYCVKVPFSVGEKPDSSKLVDDMISLLNLVMSVIMKNGFNHKYFDENSKKITRVMIALSSPWFLLSTKHISISNETEFVITNLFIDNVIKNEELLLQKKISESAGGSFKIIEKSILHTKINGYMLNDVIGKKTKKFDAFLCVSVVSDSVLEKIHTIISNHTHKSKENVLVHTFPLVSFSVIRDIFSATPDFIIMDVTGEVTDVTLVQNEIMIKSVSFPSGKNFIIRQIAKNLNISPEIAESTFRIYTEERLDNETSIKIESTLLDVEKEWSIYLENALQELSEELNLPSNVYLTVDSDAAPIYKDFLSVEKTDSTAMFRKNINIVHVTKDTLMHFYNNDSMLKVNEFIALSAIFYNKLLKSQ